MREQLLHLIQLAELPTVTIHTRWQDMQSTCTGPLPVVFDYDLDNGYEQGSVATTDPMPLGCRVQL